MAGVAGTMALSMSLALAPSTMAQGSPEDAIQGFMDAVVAKDFAALPNFFCEAEAAQAAQFDLGALAGEMPPGLDVQSLLDAFILDVTLDSSEVVSESESEAVVHIVGSMSMDLDQEALVPFVEAVIEMAGMEVDDASVDMFMGMIASEFQAESESIDADVTLVPGDDGWLICSNLEFAGATMDDDGMSSDAMDDDGMSEEAADAAMDEDMSDDDTEDDGE